MSLGTNPFAHLGSTTNEPAEETTTDAVRRIAAKVVGVPLEEVGLEAILVEDLGMTSLQLITFYVLVEKELGLPTYTGMYQELTSIDAVAAAVKAQS